MLTLQR